MNERAQEAHDALDEIREHLISSGALGGAETAQDAQTLIEMHSHVLEE